MYKKMRFVIIVCTVLLLLALAHADSERDSVTISPWEYCEGCKRSVQLFSQRVSKKFKAMQSAHLPSGEKLEAVQLIDGICEDELLREYSPSVRYSCLNLLANPENITQFLLPWEGDSSMSMSIAKGDVYDRTVEVMQNILFWIFDDIDVCNN